MHIFRFLMKLILIPVSFFLLLARIVIKLTVRITSAPVGFFLILIAAGSGYCLCCRHWTELLVFIMIGFIVFGFQFLIVVLEFICDMLKEKIVDL